MFARVLSVPCHDDWFRGLGLETLLLSLVLTALNSHIINRLYTDRHDEVSTRSASITSQ